MIYFDNAATTLRKPETVIRAVNHALTAYGNPGRGVHEAALEASRAVYSARSALARLLHGGSPSRIAFTANATESLNIAIKGILNPGDHVITTALEHNSVLRPLYELERLGVELTILPADDRGRVRYEDFKTAIRGNTRAIVCTHGSNLTGNLVDIGRLGAIAKAHGLLLVVDAGVRYLLETGIDTVREQELELMWAFYDGIRDIPGVTVYGDFSADNRCPIVSLNIRDYDSAQVSDALFSQYGIATRPGAHCAPLMHDALGTGRQGAVRFSFSHYNTMEEIKTAVSAIQEIAKEE